MATNLFPSETYTSVDSISCRPISPGKVDFVIVHETYNIEVACESAEYLQQNDLIGSVIAADQIDQYTATLANASYLVWVLGRDELLRGSFEKRRKMCIPHRYTACLCLSSDEVNTDKLLSVLGLRHAKPQSLILLSFFNLQDLTRIMDTIPSLAVNCHVDVNQMEWRGALIQAVKRGALLSYC